MKVVGYTYDADTHCVEHTKEYLKEKYPDAQEEEIEACMNGEPTFMTDSEGNQLHPVFSTDEILASCSECGEVFDTSFGPVEVDEATTSLQEYVNGWMHKDEHHGNKDYCDALREHLGWCIVGEDTKRTMLLYDAVREAEKEEC